MVRLAVDFEFGSRIWWENGGQDLWDGITEGFDGSSVVLDESIADSWLAGASRIRGWDEGTDYAPHPIAKSPVDADEEF